MATQEVRSMVSETSICNQALSWLAVDPIISLEDDSNTAQWCRLNYPFLRDSVLEERMWTFATVRAVSTSADRDEWDEMYVHPMPVSWLSVYRVYREQSAPFAIEGMNQSNLDRSWRMEGGNVLSLHPTVRLWGMQRVTDTGQFSSMFVQALAARIAADAAIPFTENRNLQSDMWNLYGVKLSEAAVRDGQQGSNERIETSTLTQARYYGSE